MSPGRYYGSATGLLRFKGDNRLGCIPRMFVLHIRVEFGLDETANNRRVLDKNDVVDPMIYRTDDMQLSA